PRVLLAVSHSPECVSLLHRYSSLPHSHSFPTRRSSDLSSLPPFSAGGFAKAVKKSLPHDPIAAGPLLLSLPFRFLLDSVEADFRDRKSTRLNSSHSQISYAVFGLKKKIQDAFHECRPRP